MTETLNPMIEMLNEDCMQYMASCQDNQFDLANVDPPYFDGPNKLGYFGSRVSTDGIHRPSYKKTKNWDVPTQEYFDELLRISKNQIIWGINYYDIHNIGPGRIIWDKCNSSSSFSDCEIAYTSLHDSVRLFPFMWNGMLQGVSEGLGRTMQGNKKLNEKRIHPTQKPVALYRWTLDNYAKRGDRILDTHSGSFSHAVACKEKGFSGVFCEIDHDHFRDGRSRVDKTKRQYELSDIIKQKEIENGELF